MAEARHARWSAILMEAIEARASDIYLSAGQDAWLRVDEIRDRETMTTALMAAETGMLVLGTLHTRGAAEAVRRIEGFYPQEEQSIVRAQVADVFCAIFAQELLPARRGGRVPLVEVLLREPSVCSLIRQGKYSQIEMAMMTHQAQGMQTRRQAALQKLLQQGLIAREVYERAANRLG
ncbi:ATPase, T2SS/T4P/T4SS family [uncultured Mitsuokella sp.]|uniref:ATPase, T2SS/T4P/T4SS family n=1 Tax=uncultured Mitsuokella sp. TaxID=453120 RepID=UPI00258AD315|nr:ATPase, T2SS/T4P/T4SS family [uncultured Mitsuokella sp.]